MDCSNRSKTAMQMFASYCSDDLIIVPDQSWKPSLHLIQGFSV